MKLALPAVALLLLAFPSVAADTVTYTETFTDASYTISAGSSVSSCRTGTAQVAAQSWTLPAGTTALTPSFPAHGAGISGWHQVYRMASLRQVTTEVYGTPGLCTEPSWHLWIRSHFVAVGSITAAAANSVTFTSSADTMADYAAASGATITGTCTLEFDGSTYTAAMSGTGGCSFYFPSFATTTSSYIFAASGIAEDPTMTVLASAYTGEDVVFDFATGPAAIPCVPPLCSVDDDQITATLGF